MGKCAFCGSDLVPYCITEYGSLEYACPKECDINIAIEKHAQQFGNGIENPGDIINDEKKPYVNHCWNCGSTINGNICQRDPIPDNGYICNFCGKSLRDWKSQNIVE